MKAVIIKKHGGPEVVNIEDVNDPIAQPGEVVVEVRSAALNHLDIWVRNGRGSRTFAKPHILGSDASGVIVTKGNDVHGVKEGDEVVINPGLSCGRCEFCRRGQQSECASFGIVGMARDGTFAEKVAVPASNIWPKPAHLSFDEAAALPLSYVTAWRMLITRAKLKSSDTILIHGIGGGVASACLMFAKLMNAEVIATSSFHEKLKKAEKLGADHSINYMTTPDVANAVNELTSGRGVDIVVDAVGAATWETDLKVARRGGRIVLCGVTTGAQAETNMQRVYWNQLTVLGSTLGSDDDFRQMLKTVNNNKLKPVIDSVHPLEKVKDAMTRMERAEQFGKIVLNVSK
ncbi:MAG: zinc-binding dehydrogenase [Sedimentisphaerales bacterium]